MKKRKSEVSRFEKKIKNVKKKFFSIFFEPPNGPLGSNSKIFFL